MYQVKSSGSIAMASVSTPGFLSRHLCLLVQVSVAVLLIGATSSNAIGFGDDSGAMSQQREFDYFALSLLWPGTVCGGNSSCCPGNACCRGSNAPTEFTIHGLWPDYNDGSWPACCYRSDFDEKEISTLSDALEKYWPTLSCSSSSSCHGVKGSFWGHEWEKHGTCSSPVILDEYSYFVTTLNVYFKYNVTSVLYEAGYVPSNSEKYPLGGIVSAIQIAFHTTPEIVCRKGAVEEIRICFHKDFKPRDCVVSKDVSPKNSCPEYVSLPAYASLGGDEIEEVPSMSKSKLSDS